MPRVIGVCKRKGNDRRMSSMKIWTMRVSQICNRAAVKGKSRTFRHIVESKYMRITPL